MTPEKIQTNVQYAKMALSLSFIIYYAFLATTLNMAYQDVKKKCHLNDESNQIYCEEDGCIDGYYRTNKGQCIECSSYDPHCSKCSYEIQENENE